MIFGADYSIVDHPKPTSGPGSLLLDNGKNSTDPYEVSVVKIAHSRLNGIKGLPNESDLNEPRGILPEEMPYIRLIEDEDRKKDKLNSWGSGKVLMAFVSKKNFADIISGGQIQQYFFPFDDVFYA